MINSSWPNTPCQVQRPSLIEDDDDDHTNNKNEKQLLSRSFTFDKEPLKQKRIKRLNRPSPPIIEQQPQCLGRSLLSIDPLPYVRDMLNELSNTKAFLYARQCRIVAAKLRLCWSDVNEEIKSLLKHKEYMEAAIEHIPKDLIINKEKATLLNENSLLFVGNLLAFTSDVIQVFQDVPKLIEESCEIKKQAMNQIKDTKVYSLIVNQSIAQKLADIITLAMNKENFHFYGKVRTALNIQAKDIHEELCFVCGDETPSLKTIEEWSKWFRESREEAEDEVRSD
ncbi:unnamed protein product [Rotaria sordida]|uniref:Uncharacterized protein n=1 Tax=Rotaria sordida TaxID=392033 RepID=A0A815RC16_9BILA|nr:unnamed protein product [Rotaria sordida]